MMSRIMWQLLALLFMSTFLVSVHAIKGPQLLKVALGRDNDLITQMYHDGDVDIWSSTDDHSEVLVENDLLPKFQRVLREAGHEYDVLVEDMMHLIHEEQQYMSKTDRNKRSVGSMNWDTYHDLNTIEGYMGWLNETQNDLVDVWPIANTAEERRVYVVKVTDPRAPGPKKKIWIEGGIHAREWISPAATTYLLHQVATNPQWHPLLARTEWYFVPVANPDGYDFTFQSPKNRLWRKNRKIVADHLPDRCRGIDLNRNWDFKWGVGASKSPCSEVYRGSNPFSEPESDGLKNMMKHIGPIDLFITIHSFGQSVLYPHGWTKKAPPNLKSLQRLGKRFVDAVSQVSKDNTKYQLGGSGELYGLASGASDDFAFGALSIPYAYTIELRDKGRYGFLLPESQIGETVKETAAGIYCMAGLLTDFGPCASSNTRRRNRNNG